MSLLRLTEFRTLPETRRRLHLPAQATIDWQRHGLVRADLAPHGPLVAYGSHSQQGFGGIITNPCLPDPELLCYLDSVNLVSQVIAKAFCQQVLNIHL